MIHSSLLPILPLLVAGAPTPASAGAASAPCCGVERHVPSLLAQRDAGDSIPAPGEPVTKRIPRSAPISDAFIAAKVKIEFDRRSLLRDLDLKIRAREGTVELSGVVESDRQAQLAVKTAGEVEGVTDVKSALEVRR